MFSSPGRCEWSSESSRVAALKRLWKCVSRWEVLGTASFPTNAFPILFQSARESENEIWITAQELKITKSWSSMHFLYLKSLYALLLRDVKSPIIALIREILTGIISDASRQEQSSRSSKLPTKPTEGSATDMFSSSTAYWDQRNVAGSQEKMTANYHHYTARPLQPLHPRF